MNLTLPKYNGMISEKVFVPGEKNQYSKCLKNARNRWGFKMLKGTKAQFPDHLNEGGIILVSAMKC